MAEVLSAILYGVRIRNIGGACRSKVPIKLQKQFTTPQDAAEYFHRLEKPQPLEPSPYQSATHVLRNISPFNNPANNTPSPAPAPTIASHLLFSYQKLSRCKLHLTLQRYNIQYAFPSPPQMPHTAIPGGP